MISAVVLRTRTPGAPSRPVTSAGISAPFEVFGYTQTGQEESSYNQGMPERVYAADHLFIEEVLVQDALPRSVVRAISTAMSGKPRARNIWVFNFDSPDPPDRLSDWVKDRPLTLAIMNQYEGEI